MSEDRQRYARVHEIFASSELLRGAKREAYLSQHCGSDLALRREVEALLSVASPGGEGDLFSEPNLARSRQQLERVVDDATETWLPDHIGGYDIVRQIGEGGMGIVYEAMQRSPRRAVAIKLLHPTHATTDRMRRFRREAELLGRLQHAGIAQIYEASTYDIGRGQQPFFAMELVVGVDIRTYCDRNGLGIRARIALLAEIADAVQAAHDSGVIHRDLKPDNVLVDERGRPRILDFGVARATDDSASVSTLLTKDGQLVGTLAYMAPEQFHQVGDALTPRADVYGLGVLAFELLTGKLPRDVDGLPVPQAMKKIMETDVPPAGVLVPSLAGEIETILGKALEEDLDRRYASAAAFAGDMRRYLNSEPIQARPPSRVYLARKFARRHRSLVGGCVATLAVAIVGALVAIGYATDATSRASELERLLYKSSIGAAGTAVQTHDLLMVETHLNAAPVAHRGWEYDYLRARLVQHEQEWPTPAPVISEPVFNREGTQMFALLADATIGTWDVGTGQLTRAERIKPSNVELATVRLHGASRRFAARSPSGELVLGHFETGESQVVPFRDVHGAVWSPDGEQLLVLDEKVYVWRDGEQRLLADAYFAYGAWSPSGDRVALVNRSDVSLRATESGELLASTTIPDTCQDVSFAPDGKTLAVACYYRKVLLLDGEDLSDPSTLTGHGDIVWQAAWTADGRIITASNDLTVRVWSNRPKASSAVFRPGVQQRVWNAGGKEPVPPGRTKVAALPEGAGVVVVGDRIRVLPLRDVAVLKGHDAFVYRVAFSPDGAMLASTAFRQSEVRVWDVHQGKLYRKLASSAESPGQADAPSACFSADHRRLVTMYNEKAVAWDLLSGAKLSSQSRSEGLGQSLFAEFGQRRLLQLAYPGWTMSVDGAMALRPGKDGAVVNVYRRIREAPPDAWSPSDVTQFGAEPVFQLVGHTGLVYCIAVSPDGTRFATGGNDATVAIWDAQTGERLLVLHGHEQYVMGLAWSPDGTLLASASGDMTVRLWDSLPLPKRRAMGALSDK